MHAKLLRNTRLTGTLLFLAAALLGLIGLARAEQLAMPGAAPEAVAPQAGATLPAETCTWDGLVRTCELWATTGTVDLPGMTGVPIWGYADTAAAPAQLPGPALIVNQGETVQVILHNNLVGENTSLFIEGQDGLPDLAGVAPGDSKTYTVNTSNPGTFLYEAGPLANAQHQVALGLYGALVVRPAGAPLQAYADPGTAFDDEALLVLSEVDPALNNTLDPATFDMRNYSPKYWLINGKTYPGTDSILTEASRKVLLRYANAGQQPHTMTILGTDQNVLSLTGAELPHYRKVASEILSPGQSADAIATMPAAPPAGTERFVLYDASLLLHNNGAAGFGGMLTFLLITPQTPGTDTVGPTAGSLALSVNPTNGTTDVLLTASISDVASGGSVVTAAEYFIDAAGAAGTGLALTASDLAFDSSVESVQATITVADLALLTSGQHAIYVHGQDANGNWGVFNSIVLRLDKAGPATSSIVLTPAVSDGNVDVGIQATGSDTATGNTDVVAAEYTIDGGPASPMALNQVAPVVSLTATIPAATMQALSEGGHTLAIRSQDALGNWGADATATLAIDKSGPVASNVSAYPNPNNGTLGVNPITPSVRVDVTLDDPLVSGVNSSVNRAEGFIDTVGATGTGFPFTPSDGAYNSAHELAYAFIPLSTVNALSQGPHTIYVRGKDAAGNWGATATTILVVDKTRPVVSGLNVSPNPTGGVAIVTLTGSATDSASNIVRAEWFEGTDPGPGNASAMSATDGTFNSLSEALTASVNVSGWAAGNHTLYVRAKDAAGNWSLTANVVVTVQPPDLIFADSFESGNFGAWAAVTGPISVTGASAMVGAFGMQAALSGNTPGFVTDNAPANEPTYHARFYFNPHGTLTGNTQQDIFAGLNTAGTRIFRVQYRRTAAGGGTYQVRLAVLRAGGTTTSTWFTIANNTPHSIEIDWQSAASATVRLYVDGVLRRTLTGLNTSAYLVDSAQLGPSLGLVGAASGTEYFDHFESRRYTYIGP